MTFKIRFFAIVMLPFFLQTATLQANDLFLRHSNSIRVFQDNTVLIKKIKAKINALSKRRDKLKELKKWSNSQEKKYNLQLSKLNKSLNKLGEEFEITLNVEQIVSKLQKQLKYLNNARVNSVAKNKFTQKDDSIYKRKAGKLIDSILRLRRSIE
ncbi:hypothetical protein BXQ17_01880 [Polaribacter sp. BM10]|uniref:hypothetical protein n=1 Tax=Polaribacter sp. BM10 TaxID=1529069 RepID=UPI00098B2C17|nr:hypothetical protein [Polaribacter sp. BM10]AQS92891.1 hypothetical protein BXQ17_01880 [Polaribacter sp. BM10]